MKTFLRRFKSIEKIKRYTFLFTCTVGRDKQKVNLSIEVER